MQHSFSLFYQVSIYNMTIIHGFRARWSWCRYGGVCIKWWFPNRQGVGCQNEDERAT